MAPLIPGELLPEPGELELNAGRPVTTLSVSTVSYTHLTLPTTPYV